jgi:hypothetical protein
LVGAKFQDENRVGAEEFSDLVCRTTAYAQKNEFGWVSEHKAALMEIGVLGNDGKAVALSELPDQFVIRIDQVP